MAAEEAVRWAAGGRIGIAASVLVHAAILGFVSFDWADALTAPPEAVPVTIIPDPQTQPPPKPAPPKPSAPKPDALAARPPPPPPATPSGPGASTPVTDADLAAITARVESCWKAPAGWSDPKEVSVTVAFRIGAGGAVTAPPTIIAFRPTQIGIAAAKAALDAVTACGPYPLATSDQSGRTVEIRLQPHG